MRRADGRAGEELLPGEFIVVEGRVETPFTRPGRFWRGNLHTHSTLSDGHRSPEDVCRFYETAGYDFLALTEHFLEQYDWPIVDTWPFRTERFTTCLLYTSPSPRDS